MLGIRLKETIFIHKNGKKNRMVNILKNQVWLATVTICMLKTMK
jgi:hypothetical protein